jgi:hypothetical protein
VGYKVVTELLPPPPPPLFFPLPVQRLESAEHQRDVSLDYVASQSARVEEANLRASEAEARAVLAKEEAARANEERIAADARAVSRAQVQQMTHAALQAERVTGREAGLQASRAEAAMHVAQSEIERLRSDLSSSRAAFDEISTALSERDRDLGSLKLEMNHLRSELRRGALDREAAAGDAQAASQSAQERREQLEHVKATLSADIATLQGRLKDGAARSASLLAENASMAEALQTAQAEIAALRASRAILLTGGGAEMPQRSLSSSATSSSSVVSTSRLPGAYSAATASDKASYTTQETKEAVRPRLVSSSTAAAPVKSTSVSSSTSAAAILVRNTLREAGLDESEADKWFPSPHSTMKSSSTGSSARAIIDVDAATNHLSSSLSGIASSNIFDVAAAAVDTHESGARGPTPLLSPASAVLQAAVEKARARRKDDASYSKR